MPSYDKATGLLTVEDHLGAEHTIDVQAYMDDVLAKTWHRMKRPQFDFAVKAIWADWRGRAIYREHRLTLTLGPAGRLEHFQLGLVHELAHLVIGPSVTNGRSQHHGVAFREEMAWAVKKLWGVDVYPRIGMTRQQKMIEIQLDARTIRLANEKKEKQHA